MALHAACASGSPLMSAERNRPSMLRRRSRTRFYRASPAANDLKLFMPPSLVQSCRLSCLGRSAFVLDGLRDALVGVRQRTRSRLVETLQFNELKSSYRKTPRPPSFGGSEGIVVRIADRVLFGRTPSRAFACTICLSQSPRQVSNLRAVPIQEWSSGTDFRLPATLSSGTGSVPSPRAATITPNFPSLIRSAHAVPRRVARMRSAAHGVPPRCT